jgi:hypothetical protein
LAVVYTFLIDFCILDIYIYKDDSDLESMAHAPGRPHSANFAKSGFDVRKCTTENRIVTEENHAMTPTSWLLTTSRLVSPQLLSPK